MRHTDGKLLTFVRCRSALDKSFLAKIYKSCTKVLNKNKVFNTWNGVFGIYWNGRPEHPINLALKDFNLK